MKKNVYVMLVAILLIGSLSNLYPVVLRQYGFGAKASAMGGAFVGLADDFSAVYWNPAGLIQQKKASFFVSLSPVVLNSDYSYSEGGVDTGTVGMHSLCGAIGYVKPLSPKMVFAVSAHESPIVGAKWDGADFRNLFDDSGDSFQSSLKDFTLSPAISCRLSRNVLVGAALNLHYTRWQTDIPSFFGQYSESLNGFGVGATVGILVNSFKDSCTFGVVVRTPVKVKLNGDASLGDTPSVLASESGADRKITLPMWVGAGLALKTYKKLWATFDVHYTKWSPFNELAIHYDDPTWATFVDGKMFLKWFHRTQVRVGMEYKASPKLSFRGGYYRDHSPAPNTPIHLLLPSTNINWITFGFGYKTDRLKLEASVEWALNDDLELETLVPDYDNPDFGLLGIKASKKAASFGTLSMKTFVPTISLTYHF